MRSLKAKIIFMILVLTVITSVSTVTMGVMSSFNVTENIVQSQFEEKLIMADNMMDIYIDEQFGKLSINKNGDMVDAKGQVIEGRFDYIDELSEGMDIVSTIFSKRGNDYTRILTTIKTENGERAVGTTLDPDGLAYKEVSNGNVYFGEAEILGKQYITRYEPVYDNN